LNVELSKRFSHLLAAAAAAAQDFFASQICQTVLQAALYHWDHNNAAVFQAWKNNVIPLLCVVCV
jgi:hypothetical protein